MSCPNLIEKIRSAGFKLELTEDWQQIQVSGDVDMPSALEQQLMDDKEGVKTLLQAEALATGLGGRTLSQGEVEVPTDYFNERSATTPVQKTSDVLGEWLELSESMLANRDEKNRLNVTDSEVYTCLHGVQGFPDNKAKEMHQRLKDARPEAKKFTLRLKNKYKRAAEKRRRKNNPPQN